MVRRLRDPLVLLAIASLLSLAVRVALLDQPCRVPCRSASDHVLIFDETYYVNAARVIAGVALPPGTRYAGAPSGDDPNAEHPQLAKLVIAGSIELFGDGPFAWRVGSVLVGSLALLGLFALARAAGAGRFAALGACALMAADNLLIVHGRIATLDIYAVAAMVWAVALYLRGRTLWAGVAIGVGTCFKLVAPYALLVIVLVELFTHLPRRSLRRRVRSLSICTASVLVTFIALLTAMDQVAPPYDAAVGRGITGGPFAHLSHMVSYAAHQASPSGPHGIASYPWQWLVDFRPIVYLNIVPTHPAPGLYGIHPPVHFLGMISPPILAVGLPALLLGVLGLARGVAHRLGRLLATPGQMTLVGIAWVLGTLAPFELLSVLWSRTSYIYYMVVVMPGIYLLVADLLARIRTGPRVLAAYAVAVVGAAVVMYPFTPLP